MFSSFSFGKIIKTVLPGGILFTAFVLLTEAILRLSARGSLLVVLTNKDLVATFATAAVIFSLILGFFLNTFVWMVLNVRFRKARDSILNMTVFPTMRKKLSEDLWDEVKHYLEYHGEKPDLGKYPARESLEYYYLPVISLENLNYLWESYFSWYEFQLNTASAIGFLAITGVFLLSTMWLKVWTLGWFQLIPVVFGLILFTYILILSLCKAALANLVEYEKNLMLLLMGSLTTFKERK